MTDLHFLIDGKAHYVRIRSNLDVKNNRTVVYEGLVDGREYVFFEVDLDEHGAADVWLLFERAVAAYRAQRAETELQRNDWRND